MHDKLMQCLMVADAFKYVHIQHVGVIFGRYHYESNLDTCILKSNIYHSTLNQLIFIPLFSDLGTIKGFLGPSENPTGILLCKLAFID